jgi:predicted MFS family arabinose efflux permease
MILAVFAFCSFAASTSGRAVDPMTALIAADFSVPVSTAALLSSAYALPFALFQPILGPIGDIWGKSRLLRVAVWLLALTLLAGAFAPTLAALMALRFIGGIGGGGTIPSGMALIGDRYQGAERQVAIGKFVGAGLAGQIFGAAISGIVADALGWRTTLLLAGGVALAAAITATATLREPANRPERQFSLAEAVGGYRKVFANPRAYLCFGTVLAEGIALWGVTPFVVDILIRAGTGGTREAGFAIGAIGVGGLVLTVILSRLLRLLGRTAMMTIGGILGAAGPLGLALGLSAPWIVALFAASGFGYMMLHNSIQGESVELAPTARSSAYSMHAFFFFVGQSLGPVIVGLLIHFAGPAVATGACAILFALTGGIVAMLFDRLDRLKADPAA